jgi:hypothetical protein
MFGVDVVALQGDKRGATRMAFGLPEWVIGLLGSESWFSAYDEANYDSGLGRREEDWI